MIFAKQPYTFSSLLFLRNDWRLTFEFTCHAFFAFHLVRHEQPRIEHACKALSAVLFERVKDMSVIDDAYSCYKYCSGMLDGP